MNDERRKKLEAARSHITDAINLIEEVKQDEQDAFDNMPEGLQAGEKGQTLEENVATLESAIDALNGSEGDLDNVS